MNPIRLDRHERLARAAMAVEVLSRVPARPSTPANGRNQADPPAHARRFANIDEALVAVSRDEPLEGAVVDLAAVVEWFARPSSSQAIYARFLRREPMPVTWVIEQSRHLADAAPIAAFLLTDEGWEAYGHQLRNWTIGTLLDRLPG